MALGFSKPMRLGKRSAETPPSLRVTLSKRRCASEFDRPLSWVPPRACAREGDMAAFVSNREAGTIVPLSTSYRTPASREEADVQIDKGI
jgi:hypothetical protein